MVPGSGAQPGSTGYEAQQPYNVPQDYSVQVNTVIGSNLWAPGSSHLDKTAQVKPGHDSSRALKPQRAAAGTPQSNVQIGRLVRESGRAVPDTTGRPLSSGVWGRRCGSLSDARDFRRPCMRGALKDRDRPSLSLERAHGDSAESVPPRAGFRKRDN